MIFLFFVLARFLYFQLQRLIFFFTELAPLLAILGLRTSFISHRILSRKLGDVILAIRLGRHDLNAQILLQGSVIIKNEFLHNTIDLSRFLSVVINLIFDTLRFLFFNQFVLIKDLLFDFVHDLLVDLCIIQASKLPILIKLLKDVHTQLTLLLLDEDRRCLLNS